MRRYLLSLIFITVTCAAFAQEEVVDEAQYMPSLKAGTLAPEFTSNTPEGKEVKLSDFRGKYVILDFWASWCIDCRRETPMFKQMYEEYKDKKIGDKPIEFVSLSFDNNKEQWLSFLSKNELPWTQLSNLMRTKDDPIFSSYELHWIPAFFIISPEGTILGTGITVDGIRKEIEKLTE